MVTAKARARARARGGSDTAATATGALGRLDAARLAPGWTPHGPRLPATPSRSSGVNMKVGIDTKKLAENADILEELFKRGQQIRQDDAEKARGY